MKSIIKNNIKLFVGLIIGMFFSGITVYAATKYLSSDVVYEPSNPEWNVSSVEEALNDLYDKKIKDVTLYKEVVSDYGSNASTINVYLTDVEKGNYLMEIYRTTYDNKYGSVTYKFDYDINFNGTFDKISNTLYRLEISDQTNINIISKTGYVSTEVGGHLYVNLFKIN